MSEARKTLRTFIISELANGITGSDISDESDLLTTGVIDSLGVMRLTAFIQSEFSYEVPMADLTIENFESIDAICAYLTRSIADTAL